MNFNMYLSADDFSSIIVDDGTSSQVINNPIDIDCSVIDNMAFFYISYLDEDGYLHRKRCHQKNTRFILKEDDFS